MRGSPHPAKLFIFNNPKKTLDNSLYGNLHSPKKPQTLHKGGHISIMYRYSSLPTLLRTYLQFQETHPATTCLLFYSTISKRWTSVIETDIQLLTLLTHDRAQRLVGKLSPETARNILKSSQQDEIIAELKAHALKSDPRFYYPDISTVISTRMEA